MLFKCTYRRPPMIIPIGSKIKALRQKRKICQQDLCCEILSRTILSKIENNRMLPSIPQLEHISKVLNMPIYYFFRPDDAAVLGEPANIDEEIDNIMSLYDNKKYLDIIGLYEQGILKINKNLILLYYSGMSYFYAQLHNNSLILLRKFITAYKSSSSSFKYENIESYASSLNILSSIMIKNSNYNKALSYLYEASKVLELHKKCNTKIYDIVINNMGAVYCRQLEYEKAIGVLEAFLSKKYDMVYLFALSSIHLSLNLAYYHIGKYTESIKHIKNALWLFDYIGKSFDSNECYLNYINVLRFARRFDEALKLIDELKETKGNNNELLNLLLTEEITVYFNMDKFDEVLRISCNIKVKDLRKSSRMDYYMIMGHVLFLEGSLSSAYTYLNKCKKYFLNQKFYSDLSLIYDDLSIILNDGHYNIISGEYKKMPYAKNIVVR